MSFSIFCTLASFNISSHSESFDENVGEDIVDLVSLFLDEKRMAPTRTSLPSNLTSRHEGIETKGEEEGEGTSNDERERMKEEDRLVARGSLDIKCINHVA